jgi:hypothetical protein
MRLKPIYIKGNYSDFRTWLEQELYCNFTEFRITPPQLYGNSGCRFSLFVEDHLVVEIDVLSVGRGLKIEIAQLRFGRNIPGFLIPFEKKLREDWGIPNLGISAQTWIQYGLRLSPTYHEDSKGNILWIEEKPDIDETQDQLSPIMATNSAGSLIPNKESSSANPIKKLGRKRLTDEQLKKRREEYNSLKAKYPRATEEFIANEMDITLRTLQRVKERTSDNK